MENHDSLQEKLSQKLEGVNTCDPYQLPVGTSYITFRDKHWSVDELVRDKSFQYTGRWILFGNMRLLIRHKQKTSEELHRELKPEQYGGNQVFPSDETSFNPKDWK